MVSYKALNTITEASRSQTRDGIRNGDRCQTAAVLEAIVPQTPYGIYNTSKGHSFGNNHLPRESPAGHWSCLICCIQIVVNAIYYYVKSPYGMEAKEQSEE